MPSFIKLINAFSWLELRRLIFVHLAMELRLGVEAVSVLRTHVLRVQDRVRLPALTVPVIAILLEPTRRSLLDDQVSRSRTRVVIRHLLRANVGGFSGARPL